MTSTLFAFNVSKMIDTVLETAEKTDSTLGKSHMSLVTELGFCSSGQGYGVSHCISDSIGCRTSGNTGIYICDITRYD